MFYTRYLLFLSSLFWTVTFPVLYYERGEWKRVPDGIFITRASGLCRGITGLNFA
jgi:hypothetical protein